MDFAGWVSEHLTVYVQSGNEWVCECPDCGGEKLAVNVALKAWRCFHCKFSGWSPARLVMRVLDLPPVRAGEIVVQYGSGLGRLSPRVGDLDIKATIRPPIPSAPVPPGTLWSCVGREAAYAKYRGIPSDHAYWFGLSSIHGDGGQTLASRMLAGRLLIPVWDHNRKLVHWVARATEEDSIKTINLPDSCNGSTHEKGPPCKGTPDCCCKHERWGLSPTPHVAGSSEALVGLHLVQPGSRVVVVEGPIDAAVCGPGFAATMGARLSFSQAALLVRAGVESVVILFDPDEPGAKGAEDALALLSPLIPTGVAECPPGTDPAVLGRDRCLKLADTAKASAPLAALSAPPPRRQRQNRAVHPLIEPL